MKRKPTKQERDAILHLKPTPETCCGTCQFFEDECDDGYGYCIGKFKKFCGDICLNYKKENKPCGK